MSFTNRDYDSYWRLSDEYHGTKNHLHQDLRKAGYEAKKSLTRGDLVELMQIRDTRFIGYDDCDDAELLKFAIDRHLVTANKKPTKRWLADKLMKADKDRTFAKFLDLPAELRRTVYDMYMADFSDKVLIKPSQPPLARTCRMLRSEVLPVFYDGCTFDVNYMCRGINRDEVRLRLSDESYIFLSTLAPKCLGDIRKLKIRFDGKWGGFLSCTECNIDLGANSSNTKVTLRHELHSCGLARQDCGVRLSSLENQISKVLQGGGEREGTQRLRLDDIFNLRVAIEEANNLSDST